ncbi:MAG: rRNA maturation factor, partial [Betaproteobacteria bacterium]|nr:rRNA maturation factor [Betaproteobacteria bacterium]
MALKQLSLSLQFGDIPHAAIHRAALPRHFVMRCIRH